MHTYKLTLAMLGPAPLLDLRVAVEMSSTSYLARYHRAERWVTPLGVVVMFDCSVQTVKHLGSITYSRPPARRALLLSCAISMMLWSVILYELQAHENVPRCHGAVRA
ncbi:hypothetical protein GDO81_029528 [Engystomops pustulosus]|uniref:Uncharacterized protein n=1 Tax=Engystomops pustulosus TaxID=76066 RepID=A0AAV6YV59_ENGPU|nr:hypothetical protein GDO81_029528 [Engystomops pustulosus]